MLQLALLSLATWRLTALLVYEAGPRDMCVRLRNISDVIGGPLMCFWCTSVWVGLLASVLLLPPGGGWAELVWWPAGWLALSAAAILIDEVRWAYFPPEECDAETEEGEAAETADYGQDNA